MYGWDREVMILHIKTRKFGSLSFLLPAEVFQQTLTIFHKSDLNVFRRRSNAFVCLTEVTKITCNDVGDKFALIRSCQ